MNIHDQVGTETEKLSVFSRVTRVALGVALLTLTMSQGDTLGVLAVLPLLAIYPILSGVLGYGLVELAVAQHQAERPVRVDVVSRAFRVIIGTGLIAAVMAGVTTQAWVALLGVYPILSGVLGFNMVSEAFSVRRAIRRANRVYSFSGKRKGGRAKAQPTAAFDAGARKAA